MTFNYLDIQFLGLLPLRSANASDSLFVELNRSNFMAYGDKCLIGMG